MASVKSDYEVFDKVIPRWELDERHQEMVDEDKADIHFR